MPRNPNLPTQLLVALAACAGCTALWTIAFGPGNAFTMTIGLALAIGVLLLALRAPQFVKRLTRALHLTPHYWRFVPRRRLAMVSLLFAVLVLGLRWRSHAFRDALSVSLSDRSNICAESFLGILVFTYETNNQVVSTEQITFESSDVEPLKEALQMTQHTMDSVNLEYQLPTNPFRGSVWNSSVGSLVTTGYSYVLPHWTLALFFAFPLIICLAVGAHRFRRDNKNRCVKCGYNLTGNTTGTCPECGEKI